MLTAETTISTDRPGRYLSQLCRHATAMGATGGGHRPRAHGGDTALTRGAVQVSAEYTDSHGVLTLAPWGRCTLTADADAGTLTLRVEATHPDALHRIQDILARDLRRFGRRDNLAVTWPSREPAGGPATTPHRRNRVLLGVLVAVAIAVHLGLGGLLLSGSRLPSLTVDALLTIVLGKVVLVWLLRRVR